MYVFATGISGYWRDDEDELVLRGHYFSSILAFFPRTHVLASLSIDFFGHFRAFAVQYSGRISGLDTMANVIKSVLTRDWEGNSNGVQYLIGNGAIVMKQNKNRKPTKNCTK